MKNLLVTGGLGFIGSNFIRYLLDKYPEINITNLDAITYAANPENLSDLENPNYKFIKGDIRDPATVSKATKNVDTIVHIAAESHVDNSIKGPLIFTETNVLGTHLLLESARKQNIKFLLVSTDEVYGSIKEGRANENSPSNPGSPYAASKAGADSLALAYHNTYKLPIIITRSCNNYGPYQHPEKVIPHFITELLLDRQVPLYGDGKNIREWIHVLDHCRALDLILEKGKIGEVYNISTEQGLTNIELTKLLLSLLEKSENYIKYVTDRLGHDRRYAIDSSKLRSLGFSPKINFKKGLKDTVTWYKEHEEWWKKLKA